MTYHTFSKQHIQLCLKVGLNPIKKNQNTGLSTLAISKYFFNIFKCIFKCILKCFVCLDVCLFFNVKHVIDRVLIGHFKIWLNKNTKEAPTTIITKKSKNTYITGAEIINFVRQYPHPAIRSITADLTWPDQIGGFQTWYPSCKYCIYWSYIVS